MTAGRRRERVAFDQRAVDPESGRREGKWAEAYRCAARIQPLCGTETVIARRLEGVQTVAVNVLACAATRAVTTDWRLRDVRAGRTYNIVAVTPSETRAEIEILAETGGADG